MCFPECSGCGLEGRRGEGHFQDFLFFFFSLVGSITRGVSVPAVPEAFALSTSLFCWATFCGCVPKIKIKIHIFRFPPMSYVLRLFYEL